MRSVLNKYLLLILDSILIFNFFIESDSDSESQEGFFYSVHEQKKMHKKKQLLENNTLIGQSKIVIHLTVAQGLCDLFAPARVSQSF